MTVFVICWALGAGWVLESMVELIAGLAYVIFLAALERDLT